MRSYSLRVEPSTIIFPYTYISSTTRFTIQIYNDTKRNLHFEWRKRESESEDENFIKTCDLDDPNQRQDIQKNLEFQSKYFTFEQKSGEIWPLRFQQQVVSFTPDLSIPYQDDAYLYVLETGERFHVLLKGTGLAPEAMFSIQSLNVGHVFLESIFEYEIYLQNIGKANVEFCLAKHPTPGLIFEFTPEEGILYVNQKITIHIKFVANMVGSFNESFTYKVKGAVQGSPAINIYGKVIGPTFSLSTKLIDFGTVSYGFMYTKNFDIENKSEIPFDYSLSLSQDGSFSRREFSIKPSSSSIGKYTKQPVLLEFIPVSLQNYELDLNLDIAKYGEKLASIPIKAKCICPEIQIETNQLDMGNIFIGHCYKASIDLIDDTDYPAKYEFIPVTDSTQLQAKTVVPKPNGTIYQHDRASLELLITPIQLGPILLNQKVRIYGNDSQPISFTIAAICVGPDIKLSQNSIDFGQINVLQEIKHQISINNNSLIPAIFTARIEDEAGVFTCDPSEATIPPNENMMFTVVANLDDNITFHAKLILMFQNLNPIVVPIKGTGIGNTIRTSVNMNKIDMNYIFTERPVYFDFIVYNKGRRPLELRWTIQKPKIEGQITSIFTFKINPESTTIPAYDEIPCRMTFQCNKPTSFITGIQGYTTIKKKRTELFNPQIKGTFVRPELRFSQQTIEFHHLHDIASEEKETGDLHTEEPIQPSKDLLPVMTQQVNIKNAGKLGLNMKFDCPKPFSISETKFHLDPDEDHIFDITFDPSFKTDFISELITKKISISFDSHPQVNYITLKGFIEFPNVIFSPSMNIDFGNLMINTEQTKDITIDNQSELPVDLYWELFVNDKPCNLSDNTSSIFDIYPIRAHIDPKTKDVVRFSFFAIADPSGKSTKYKGKAICHIVGGPEYTLNISGGSAAIQYKIDPLRIDFGELSYKTRVHKTLSITNSSDVSISYTIKIPRGCSFQSFLVNPLQGTISQNQVATIDLQILGGLPKVYNESFFVQIGHYDDIRIDVLLNCFIPQIQIGLPHHEDDPLMKAFNEYQSKHKALERRVETESDDEDPQAEIEPTEDELTEFERKLLINKMTEKSSTSFFNRLSRVQKTPIRFANRSQAQQEMPLYDGPVSSKLILDMGKIVFGEIKTKEFRLKSPTPYPITFDISTASLEGTGFSIDPSSFADLPPNEEIIVTAKFDTKMRTNDLVGLVEFEIPIVLNDDVGYLVILTAILEMPKLSFSKVHCDFGNVIVGQCYIMNIQLQNMNPVACEFKFEEAQFINVLHRSMAAPSVFEANPSSGILQPASFQNVEISFSPLSEKSYSMQFPITVKHNTQNSYVTLRGYGIQLRVLFDPPELIMPPLNPFSEPTTMDVKLINPTDYPIIVLSSQFDLQLLVDQAIEEQNIKKEESSQQDDSAVQFTNATTAKFSICVIVSGAPGSGKTTVSKAISHYLDDAPILSLKEIWKDVITNPEAPQADYVEAFSKVICSQECSNGFIIDGLDCLPEPADLDSFLQKCAKTKNVESELLRNPLTAFPHATLTAAEQALSYVLAALDGHYVFHIALKASEAVLNAREEIIKAQEKRKKRIEQHQEKKMLFNMTEEQYAELSEEKQIEVDEKREKLRKKLLKRALEEGEGSTDKKSSSAAHRSHSSSKHHSHSKSKEEGGGGNNGDSNKPKTSRRSKSEKGESSSKSKREKSDKEASNDGAEKKSRRSKGLPQDPIPYSVYQYQFTVGSIAQRLLDGGEYFQVIDPVDFLKETPPPTAHDNEEEETKNETAEDESSKKEEAQTESANNNPTEEEQEKEKEQSDRNQSDEVENEKMKEESEKENNNNNDEEDRINNRNSTPMPRHHHHHHHHKHRSKDKDSVPSNVYHNMNTLIINTIGTVDEINNEVLNFIPSVKSLKEKAFTRFIPQPRLITKVPNLKKISLSNVPQFFSIIVDDPITDITELFPELQSGHHHSSSSGRKSSAKKSRSSHHHDKKNQHIPTIPDGIDLSTRTKRWEIEPKSDVTITIVFNAKYIGDYRDILTFNILHAKAETAKLRVSGICAYPDIERSISSIFPKVQKKYDSKISFSYACDVQEFHFGSVLVAKERTSKNQVPQYHQSIKLRNISLFPAEIVATLTDPPQKGIWWSEKNSFVIEPEETFEFQFGCHPVVPDLYKTTLIFTIKDQPDPLLFNLVCEGCAPTVDMDMKAYDFEKILLNHQKTLKIELKNIGKLQLFWRIKGAQQLGPNFIFNQLEGTLKPKQVFRVLSTFTSSKPLIVKKGVSLEILDFEKQRIFSTYQIPVSAEAFDVNFDFLFPKGLDHLNYGSLKVNQTKTIQCVLKNKGKYPSMFKIVISPLKIAKLFNANPTEGLIQPNATQQINFAFNSQRLVNFNNSKGVILQITDSLTNIITAEIPLSFSAQTLYSSFIIEPVKPINFGSTPVNVSVTKQFKITNNGAFSFEYEITGKPSPVVPVEAAATDNKKKKQPQKASPAAKGRPRKGNEKSMTVGSFVFVPSVGVVQPRATATIDIDFNCLLPGFSQSSGIVKISDVDPNLYPEGTPIEVNGSTFVPGINTTDFERIFAGTHLCLRFDLARITNTTVFLEDEQILHFAPLILQKKEIVPVTLINPQPIPISVDISIQPNTKSKAAKVNFPFDINEKAVDIPPNENKIVELSFSPATQEKFQTIFEAVVKNGTNPDTKCFRFGIEAVGTLPSICYIPPSDSKGNKSQSSYTFNLGKTLVGFTKDKTIAIKNDGLIPARLAITAKASPDFALQHVETAEEFLLEQEHILNLPVIFQPEKVRKSQFDIGISVLDNPKANLNFSFIGEGFSEDVSFEGLSDDDGNLIFKDNIVGRQLEASFIMRNVSQNDIKFMWPPHSDFNFTPRNGHLRLGKTKTIKVTFFTDKPQKTNGLKISCQWSKIELTNPNAPDWDDSQKMIKFVTKGFIKHQEFQAQQQELLKQQAAVKVKKRAASPSKKDASQQLALQEPPPDPSDDEIVKVTEIKPEPDYTVIPGKYKDLQLKIIAISDFIKYSMDTTEIEFSPTMMFQSRTVECKITNTSQIRFEYQWIVTQFHCLRSDYAATNKPPFNVFPTSGFIEAGHSTVFKVKFTPEEVDDFTATLICDIPYLTQMKPPSIKVTGFSRRPLCHFNVDMSDYISAGRRHPDYTEELPDDVKVIEIFSPSVGTRSTKKFEIINPTASPYQVNWTIDYDASGGALFCDTPSAVVSSGKRHMASFTYLPTSVKTLEKLYEFHIPEHNVRIPFLVVGRIMPNT